jgi:hypothetical protein
MALGEVVGCDGLARLLSMVKRPIKDLDELLEIIRRLHIPHYEEARKYWGAAEEDGFFDGASEYWPYLQSSLERLVKQHGGE